MFEVSIPIISDEELMKRYEHIKPVIKVDEKLHYFREFTLEELRGICGIATKMCEMKLAKMNSRF